MGDIVIDTDTLRQHASGVERLAADAVEALSAVQSVNLSGGAFGVLCSFFVPPVGIVSAAVGAAIDAGEGAIERTGREIRAVADDFQTYEDSVVDTVRSLDGELGR